MPPAAKPDYWQRAMDAWQTQDFGDDIPSVESVFRLRSGARVKLVDRCGSMVIIEVEEYRSDWIE